MKVTTVATRSTEECSASEISASAPIATPNTNLAAAIAALATIEIAATRDLDGAGVAEEVVFMRAGLAAQCVASTCGVTHAIATHLQERCCCELFRFNVAASAVVL